MTIAEAAAAAKSTDLWLDRMASKHQGNLISAIRAVDRRTQTLIRELETSRGRLVSSRASLKQAQEIHTQLSIIIGSTVIKYADTRIAADLDRVVKRAAQYLSMLTGKPQSFVGVDRTWINQLKRVNLSEFHHLGEQAVDTIAKTIYEHLMGGARFADLQRAISNEYVGHIDMVGRPMTTHAKRMAFDTVRNHCDQVTAYKAEKIGLKQFIFYGDIIKDSRPFCVKHAGEIMDDKRIALLDKNTWRGKSGPLKTHRGGYNCRHQFVPIQEEWVEDEDGKIEVQNYFEEEQARQDELEADRLEQERLIDTQKDS